MRGTVAPRSIIQAVRIVTIPRKPSVSKSTVYRSVVSFDTVPTTAGAGIQSAVDAGALQIISLHRAAHTATNQHPVATHKLLRPCRDLPFDNGRRSLP